METTKQDKGIESDCERTAPGGEGKAEEHSEWKDQPMQRLPHGGLGQNQKWMDE